MCVTASELSRVVERVRETVREAAAKSLDVGAAELRVSSARTSMVRALSWTRLRSYSSPASGQPRG
jgi:hypothetical protein